MGPGCKVKAKGKRNKASNFKKIAGLLGWNIMRGADDDVPIKVVVSRDQTV